MRVNRNVPKSTGLDVTASATKNRTQRTTKNVQREFHCQELLEKLLSRQRLTFVLDVDETVVQRNYANLQEAQKQEDLESNLPAYMDYELQHAYPTSLLVCQSVEKLHELGQGVGFVSKAGFTTLIRLKMLGLDFNKIDFVGFGTHNGWLQKSDIEYIKRSLGIEDANIDSLEKLFKVLEEKHGIQIATQNFPREKWRTMHELGKHTSERILELVNRSIITIGNQSDDCEIEYPKGGLGITLKRNMKVPNYWTNSFGRVLCYGSTVFSNNPIGDEVVDQIQTNGSFREKQIEGLPILRHEIQTLTDAEAKSTWKEIQKSGPLLK